jgi:hypothetical protein
MSDGMTTHDPNLAASDRARGRNEGGTRARDDRSRRSSVGRRTLLLEAAALAVALVVIAGLSTRIGRGREVEEPPARAAALVRINRDEYVNAVRDLVFVDASHLARRLTPDEEFDGFAINVTAPASELQLEEYADLAEEIARQAVRIRDRFLDCEAEDPACAYATIDALSRRAYRRPPTSAQRETLRSLYDQAAAGGFAEGLRAVIAYVLQSPSFLYRAEHVGADGELDGHSVAARLSSFLWRSVPDDALLDAASSGRLARREEVEAFARALLRDPRATRAIRQFHREWLGLNDLEEVTKVPEVIKGWNPALRAAMLRETDRFVDEVVRADGDTLKRLLTATETVADGPLLELYGFPRSAEPVRIEFAPSLRAGILTHASVLAIHAHADQTSPVRRGLLVRRALLCDEPPPPPANVADTLSPPSAATSTRDRLAAHRAKRSCERCHRAMDPIGYGFERFDAVGRVRTHDGPAPIDDSGEIVGTDVAGPFHGAAALGERLARSAQVRSCVARKWFRFAVGRIEGDVDAPSVRAAERTLQSTGNLREMIVVIATSDAFRRAARGAR